MTVRRSPAVPSAWLLPAAIIAFVSGASADVVVNAPLTLTHRMEVQPIRVRKASGAVATVFGNTTQDTYIKQQINRVWAQAGVRIDWLPVTDYTNDFAYDGSPGDYFVNPRPDNHLDTIVDTAPTPPKNTNPKVLNMFFVETVPGFEHLDGDYANGLAFVDGNGLTVHIGANLLTFQSGRDTIASVVAHEIGHNLGLDHVTDANNLMSSNATSERLTAAQKTIVFTNDAGSDGYDLLQPLSTGTNFSAWATANGVTAGPAGDDDRDGISNVIEFMFNLNPKAASVLPQPVWSASGMTWTLPKRQAALNDGLVYRVVVASDLRTWSPAGTAGTGSVVVQDDAAALTVRLNAGSGRRFMRMDVTIPAGLAGG